MIASAISILTFKGCQKCLLELFRGSRYAKLGILGLVFSSLQLNCRGNLSCGINGYDNLGDMVL